MTIVPQPRQARPQYRNRREPIRQQDHQRSSSQPIGNLLHRQRQIRLPARHRALQDVDQPRQLRRSRARRDPLLQPRSAHRQPDAFGLREHEIRQRRSQPAGVIELRPRPLPIRHRSAAIEHEHTAEIRLFVIFFNVRPIGPPQHAPIQPPQLIAGRVKSMLPKLNAGPLHRASILPGNRSFHDASSRKLKMIQLLHERRLKIAADEAHYW